MTRKSEQRRGERQLIMTKKCIYCKTELQPDCVVDVCVRCGKGVWGERMFKAIVDSMTTEKAKGNLELGRVSETH